MNVLYQDDAVTLYHGDFRDLVDDLHDVDLTLADPPYGQTSLVWDRWPPDWPALMPGSSLWCFGSLRMFMERRDEFAAGAWQLSQDVIWEKHNGSSFHADRFRRVHEQPAHFYRGRWEDVYRSPVYTMDATKRTLRRKTRPPHTGHIERSAYASEDGGPRLMRSVIAVRSEHGRAIHPTQKPEGIIRPLIEYACPPGGLIFDPFAGSGSTGAAARQLGRRALLVEARGDYAEKAAQRLAQIALEIPA